MCKWHHGRGHKPMPPEWAERLTQHDEEPLWNAGWIPLEPQDHRSIQHPYQGHGVWQGLQVLQSHQYQGWAFTLDATPSTYDLRSQLWVFGLCVHVLSAGQLQRLGAPTDQNQGLDSGTGSSGQTHKHTCKGHRPSCCSMGGMDKSQAQGPLPGPISGTCS